MYMASRRGARRNRRPHADGARLRGAGARLRGTTAARPIAGPPVRSADPSASADRRASGWRPVLRRMTSRPAALLLAALLVVAVAARPSALSLGGLAIVLAYQGLRAALPLPRAAWPPR